ncbi:MAG: DUF4147 domain-containing protein [Alphaproteobacteria bacterium]
MFGRAAPPGSGDLSDIGEDRPLLTLPAPGLSLGAITATNAALLKSGAPITAMNCVRKHVSAIKGGRLAVACAPASVTTLAISDVPGDDLATIASGPTVADPSTFAEAQAIVENYDIDLPRAVQKYLTNAIDETPKPGDPRLATARISLIATARQSLEAAAAYTKSQGLTPIILGDDIEGDAREVAQRQAKLIHDMAPGGLLLSGGETTVTVRSTGRGGRNTEFLLALALCLEEMGSDADSVFALAGDTDGIDGTEDNAGAYLERGTLARARAKGVDPAQALQGNNAYEVFAAAGDLVTTGPTHTNVNDFRVILKL